MDINPGTKPFPRRGRFAEGWGGYLNIQCRILRGQLSKGQAYPGRSAEDEDTTVGHGTNVYMPSPEQQHWHQKLNNESNALLGVDLESGQLLNGHRRAE